MIWKKFNVWPNMNMQIWDSEIVHCFICLQYNTIKIKNNIFKDEYTHHLKSICL